MTRPVLLIGANGQLGQVLVSELQRYWPLHTATRADFDLASPHAQACLAQAIDTLQPLAIVNASAYTAVDQAENDAANAFAINAAAPAAMAAAARRQDTLLVHFSTDYVFDGKADTPYEEHQATAPLSVYGRSKLEGEHAIQAAGCRHLILRTSWLYSATHRNFLTTILKRLRHQPDQPLSIIADATGSPTSAARVAHASVEAMARCLADAPDRAREGLFHVSASGHTSWYGYARCAALEAERLGLLQPGSSALLCAIPASQRPAPAARPMQSELNNQLFQQRFGVILPHWQDDLLHTVQQLAAQPERLDRLP